jgi:glycosyltransferase involved in cell wall biosynthesis
MKGDQLRAFQLVELLHDRHELTVVTGGAASSPEAERELEAIARVVVLTVTARRRALAAAMSGIRGLPFEIGWMTPRPLAAMIGRHAATSDVAIACTIRCLSRPLPVPTVLDHVDALSANLRQRGRLERRAPLRLAARIEAALLVRHERRTARWVVGQTAVSPIDAAALPQTPPPIVLPQIQRELPSDHGTRDIDVIFTGNMRYPPNRDAAEWLISEIAPELRRRRHDVRIVVAGRDAVTLASDGTVEVLSDVPDIGALLQRSAVAVAPLRSGTGTPNKVLEAAAAGAAVVATPWVAKAVAIDLETATDARSFAAAVDRLLSSETLRRERVSAGRAALDARRPEAVGTILEELLQRAVTAGRRS